MLNHIIAFSLRNRLFIVVMTLALIVGGVYAFTQLPIDAVPDITNNQVQVLTSAPALSPLEIEKFVTAPLELSLKTLPNILELRSLSQSGLSIITLVFKDNVDPYFARQQVHERLSEAEENISSSAGKPELAPISTGLGEILRYVVKDTTGHLSAMDLRTVQDWIVRRQLQGVAGLAEVNSLGGEVKQVHVLVDPVALAGYNLTLHDVFETVSRASGNAGGAYIENGPEQYNVRSVGLAVTVDDLKSAVVKTSATGIPITLANIASVEIGPALRFGSASQDGKGEVVTGITMQLKGANSRVTVQGVKDRIEQIKPSLPPGVVIEPYYDRTALVDRTISTVLHNLLAGALFVVAVLLLFLANLRAGLILATVIPLTMLFAAICMVLTGQSGNLMSLGAIDFGLVVDGSLIIVESCLRLIAQQLETKKGVLLSDDESRHLIFTGSAEVLQAAKFGVIIIILVYLPILTLQGIEGKFFRPMALTVSYALLGALVLSVTYVPMMCYYFLPRRGHIKESKIIDFLREHYMHGLRGAFYYRKIILLSVAGLFTISIVVFSQLGGEFIPRLDEGDIAMHLIRLPSISLTESQRLSTEVEKHLKTFEEVKTVVTLTGRAEIATDPMGVELSDVFIILKPEDEWKSHRTKPELIEAMTESLKDVPGIGVQFLQPIEMRMNELIAGVRGDVAIKIFGDDFNVLNPAAQKVAKLLRSVQGSSEVTVEQTSGLPQMVVHPNREQIARYGLRVEDINDVISTAIGGQRAGEIFEGERRSDVVVRYNAGARGSADAIEAIQIPTPNGERVSLSSIATLETTDAPAQVSRENGSRFITIQANVRERDVQSFVKEVQARIASQLKLPAGYTIQYGGQFENLQAASKRLQIVVPLVLALIFLLLYQTFHSMKLGVMIFLCVPLAIIGGIAALLIGALPFSISAGVGFIALFGIAVLNGIVMVAAIRKHQQTGILLREAIVIGSQERFRPVVTTAALAGLGFLPMLIATGAGAEVQRPLATVIIGGLVSSTFLTLFVLPLVYEFFISKQSKRKASDAEGLSPVMIIAFVATSLIAGNAVAQPYRYEELKKIAIEHSPDVQRNESLLRRDRSSARASFTLPSLEGFYSVDERSASKLGKTSLGISQNFEFPLVYFAENDARTFVAGQSDLALEQTRREVIRQIATAYVEASGSNDLLQLADSALANAEHFSRLINEKREIGEINALEALQPAVAVSAARRRRSEAVVNLERSLRTLRIIAGIREEDSIVLTDRIPAMIELPDSFQNIHASLDSSISDNYLLRSASLAINAAKARERVLLYQLFPSMGLEVSKQTIEKEQGYYGAAIRLGIPIWRWLNSADRNAASAETAAMEAERNVMARALRKSVQDAFARYERAVVAQRTLENDLLPRASEAYRIALRLNDLGEASYLEVLSAQNNLIEAQTDLINARQEKEIAMIEITYLTGKV